MSSRLAESFFAAGARRTARNRTALEEKRLALQEKMAKSQQEIRQLQIQEITQKLAAEQVKQQAAQAQLAAQQRVLNPAPPEFGNLSRSGALAAAEEQANPQGLIGGADAPANVGLPGRIAQLQTSRTRDLIRSGLLDEFKKLKDLNAPLSTEGKQSQDLIEFASKFGVDSPELKILQERLGPTGASKANLDLFKAGGAERSRFLRFSTDNITSLNSFDKISRAARDSSGAGDIAIMFNFMKLLDPGSRVTSGETALAEQVSGQASQFLNLFNRVMKGERLTPQARKDILFQSGQIAKDLVIKQKSIEDQFTRIAVRSKINPDDIVFFKKEVQATSDSLADLEKPNKSLAATARTAEATLQPIIESVTRAVGDSIGPAVDAAKGAIETMNVDQILLLLKDPNVSEADIDKATVRIKALSQ